MKPGKFLAIVENNAGDRKTYAEVAILPTRLYQNDAHSSFIKYPEATFSFLLPLLGKYYNSSFFSDYMKEFRMNEIEWVNTEPILTAKIPDKYLSENQTNLYNVEEIMGMVLRQAKELVARAADNEEVIDCVVTVPSSFGVKERYSLLNALKIAKLNPLGFIEENLAATVKYALDGVGQLHKNNQTNETIVMIINIGAAATKVTIIKQSEINDTKASKNINSLQIIGQAWDDFLGGRQFDFIISELIADKFNEHPARKGKPDVRLNKKAMRRIIEKSENLKEKLSASKYVRVQLDNLADGISLNVFCGYNMPKK